MKQNKYKLWLMMVVVLIFSACGNDDDKEEELENTVLIYMAADNTLDADVDYSLEQIKEGVSRSSGEVVVYLDREGDTPRLFRLSPEGEEILLKEYAEENSANASTMQRVILETRELVPALQFGLVIWSHSMGWLPENYTSQLWTASARSDCYFPRTRYVCTDEDTGDGGSGVLEVSDMAAALGTDAARFILFDVCLMGSVEALYEIRNTCDYAIAAPTEVLAEPDYKASGMPYAKVLPYLFGDVDDLAKACEIYYTYYRDLDLTGVDITNPEVLRSATISLVDMQQLDGLYEASRTILSGKLLQAQSLNTEELQVYHTSYLPQVFFDMGDVIKELSSDAEYLDFTEQLELTVLYKAATTKFVSVPIDQEHFSGLSMYVPLSGWQDRNEYQYYFSTIDWSSVYD
ncbi:MAG: clostripain-related cysteine peptidase [Mangrovibacterium sp.]